MSRKTNFVPGEIYLVHEFDFNTHERSKYTKIGLVHAPKKEVKAKQAGKVAERNSWKRLKEHQTGNPNILDLNDDEIVFTEAVDWVEAKLHHAFAKYRVSGEWFELTNEQRAQVVKLAKELSLEAAAFPKLQATALKLESTVSNGKTIQPTANVLGVARDYLLARKQLSELDALQAKVDNIVTIAAAAGEDMKGAATTSSKNIKPRMLVKHIEALKADNLKLYEKYLVPREKWKRSFSFTYKDNSLALDEAFLNEVTSIDTALSELSNNFNAYFLNEIQLRIVDLSLIAERQTTLCDLTLRVACGKNLVIDGVCRWPRSLETEMEFDIEAFQDQNPRLVENYVNPGREVTTVKPAKRKARPS
jgi:hypothetical protein